MSSRERKKALEIVPTTPSWAHTLTNITIKSKAYWGYPQELIDSWIDVLTISSEYIQKNDVWSLVKDEIVIGYYSLLHREEHIELDNLFLLPDYIGKGYGQHLLEHAFARIQNLGFKKVILYSDPHAFGFYEKNGFKKIGEHPTSIPERTLPIMSRYLVDT